MASENRPGVIITQALSETPVVTATPSLVPVVMAPCYQIIEALTDEGDLNTDARHSDKYAQASITVTQANFPDPRGNIDELDIMEDSVEVFVSRAGSLVQLAKGSNGSTGSSFLERIKEVYRPAFKFGMSSFSALSSGTRVLVFAIDSLLLDTSKDVTVEFDNTVADADDVVSAINAASQTALGVDVAFKDNTDVVLFSPTFGPAGSVTLRAGSSALGGYLDNSDFDNTKYHRVTGSGLAVQTTGTELTGQYIEFRQIMYTVEGSSATTTLPTFVGYNSGEGTAHDWSNTNASAVTFAGSSPTIPLKAATALTAGDFLVANGNRLESNEVILVETSRFKLGTINTALSKRSATTGEYTNRVYDTLKFNTTSAASNPFSPRAAYFVAQNLVHGEVTPAGAAATLTSGTTNRIDARKGMISGEFDSAFTGAVAMTGLSLVISETVGGVPQEDVVHTFEGNLTNQEVADSITENENLSCTAMVAGDHLVIMTGSVGSDEVVTVKATGGVPLANTILGFSTVANTSATGKDIEIASKASVDSGALTLADLTNNTYTVELDIDDSFGNHVITGNVVFGGTTPAVSDVVTAVATAFGYSGSAANTLYHNGIPVATVATNTAGNGFVIETVEGGAGVDITVASVLLSSSASTHLGIEGGDTGAGADILKGTTLTFTLDSNPGTYETEFDNNSMEAAKDAINLEVGSSFDVASVSSAGALTLTSGFKGVASAVDVTDAGAGAAGVFNFSTFSATGSGRPDPDFYLNSSNAIVVGANIIRNTATGIPFAATDAQVDLFIAYKALRHDVTASAEDPGLLSFGDLDTLKASIGPVSEENPLALAAYLAMVNSPGVAISCLGLDAVSSSHEMGTVDAYLRALEFLESKEVYALAPMTDDHFIQTLVSTHVQLQSQPSERGERIAFLWKGTPTREGDLSIEGGSGTGEQTGTNNSILLEDNVSSSIIDAGISDLSSIAVSDNLYLEIRTVALGSTSVQNFSVSKVDGRTVTLRTSFSGTENDDGFYTTTAFSGTATFSSITYVMRVRGDKLLVTGTTLPDVAAITAAAAAQAEDFAHRRVFLTFADTVDAFVEGISTNLPGYYVNAGIAGMVASQPPQQPFTNLQMAGFGKVYGTDDTYSENQMDVIADGGRYVLKNQGAGIAARHQRSTSNTTLEAQELSITKAIDFLAKGLREVNRVFIGRYVITPGFLDQLTMANEGYLRRVENSVVRTANLKSLLQSEAAPDTVLIEVEVQPAYPCNKIRITIVS